MGKTIGDFILIAFLSCIPLGLLIGGAFISAVAYALNRSDEHLEER